MIMLSPSRECLSTRAFHMPRQEHVASDDVYGYDIQNDAGIADEKRLKLSCNFNREKIPGKLPDRNEINIVTRAQWGARESKEIHYMRTPVEFVFIHHTAMSHCYSDEDSCREMKKIQDFHMDDRGWDDIAYNYLVSDSGNVYEGRGWNRVGAHTKDWNDISMAICLMGNFVDVHPDSAAILSVRRILDWGVRDEKISTDYKIYGHRDVRLTECPGEKLYEIIKTWDHFGQQSPVNPKCV